MECKEPSGDLISELRSTLYPPDFDKVMRLLSLKDQENEENSAKNQVLILEMEAQLRKKDREMRSLKELVSRLEDEVMACRIREQRSEEREKELLSQCAKAEDEIKEVKLEKVKVYAEMVAWKNQFHGLESRVLRLEDHHHHRLKDKPIPSPDTGNGKLGVPDVIEIDSDDEASKQEYPSSTQPPSIDLRGSDASKDILLKQPSSGLGGADARKETPLNQDPVFVKKLKTNNGERYARGYTFVSPRGHGSSDSDKVQDPDSVIDSIVVNLQRRKAKPWLNKTGMIEALKKEPALSMKAVCALYRSRAFNHFDALRGNTLAKFLTNGDQQCKLTKSVSELQHHDPKGIEDCKRLALRYSDQLWEYESFGA